MVFGVNTIEPSLFIIAISTPATSATTFLLSPLSMSSSFCGQYFSKVPFLALASGARQEMHCGFDQHVGDGAKPISHEIVYDVFLSHREDKAARHSDAIKHVLNHSLRFCDIAIPLDRGVCLLQGGDIRLEKVYTYSSW